MIWGFVAQTRVQKWMFLLFVHWEFYFSTDFDGIQFSCAFLIKKYPASVCCELFTISISWKPLHATIVPLRVLKKSCIWLKRLDMQDDCPCRLLVETFSTSPELLHVKLSLRSVVTFQSISKFNLAETFFIFFYQTNFIWSLPKCSMGSFTYGDILVSTVSICDELISEVTDFSMLFLEPVFLHH